MKTYQEILDFIVDGEFHGVTYNVVQDDYGSFNRAFVTNFITGEVMQRDRSTYVSFMGNPRFGRPTEHQCYCNSKDELEAYLMEECSDFDWTIKTCSCCDTLVVFCGNVYDNMEATQDGPVCFSCFENNYNYCEHCGDHFHCESDDAVYVGDSCYCSDECARADGVDWCERCEEYHFDCRTVNTRGCTETWCESCTENHAFYCNCCGEYYDEDSNSYYEVEGDYLCEDCFSDNTSECDCCGDRYYDSHMYWTDDDEHLCRWCHNNELPPHRRPAPQDTGRVSTGTYDAIGRSGKVYVTKKRQTIYSYHGYPNDWRKQLCEFEGYPSNLYLGVELELNGGGEDSTKASIIRHAIEQTGSDEISVPQHVWASHDGSLPNGFELISQPSNAGFHLNLDGKGYDWKAGMQTAIDLGYVSHDGGYCGLHFHVNRDFFTVDDAEGNISIILSNNSEWLKAFSRRRNYNYCSFNYAEETTFSDSEFKDNTLDKSKATRKIDKLKRSMRGHGAAMNFSNSKTIEFRFIRGTLKYSTFVAAVQLITMFCEFANTEQGTCALVNLRSFINLARKRKYKEFLLYLKERDILPTHTPNEDRISEEHTETINERIIVVREA